MTQDPLSRIIPPPTPPFRYGAQLVFSSRLLLRDRVSDSTTRQLPASRWAFACHCSLVIIQVQYGYLLADLSTKQIHGVTQWFTL